ncbi:MAG: SDR family oxidoreductase [bacterium]|nr:SDR family oxidoreductase [bacterium]
MKFKYQLPEKIDHLSFLITGGAGFIGSNLIDFLLQNKAKRVRVLDNLSTGFEENIKEFISYSNFEFFNGDITIFDDCLNACEGIDIVFHEAALGSVPRSIVNPMATNNVNISGFVNMLFAANKHKVKRFVYASSSSVYGDDKNMPKQENLTGNLLSPYAVTKKANELYADIFARTYGMEVIGLRYFNVFGPKQNIVGPYAAVIPIFITQIIKKESPTIFGTGQTTRDFTFVEDIIQANILAGLTENEKALNQVYNVAYGSTTSLNNLFEYISERLGSKIKPIYSEERKGDIRDSFADINKAKSLLGYLPTTPITDGVKITVDWYIDNFNSN